MSNWLGVEPPYAFLLLPFDFNYQSHFILERERESSVRIMKGKFPWIVK
uniref:Uncharacterized protein n=1 Tax=Rhizophora mucronata TaxID=61149 RepID=A0A2P2INR3_RHIMU